MRRGEEAASSDKHQPTGLEMGKECGVRRAKDQQDGGYAKGQSGK